MHFEAMIFDFNLWNFPFNWMTPDQTIYCIYNKYCFDMKATSQYTSLNTLFWEAFFLQIWSLSETEHAWLCDARNVKMKSSPAVTLSSTAECIINPSTSRDYLLISWIVLLIASITGSTLGMDCLSMSDSWW